MWEAVITRSGRALLLGLTMVALRPAAADINAVIVQPGGSNGSVQYKRSGAFGGDSSLTYSTATNRLSVPSITAPIVNVTTLIVNGATYYYPTTQTGGYFLRTDGAGNLTWASPASFITSTGVALGVYDGGVQISSPTSALNFSGTQFIVSLQGTTTAAVTLDKSSVTLMGALSATAPLLLSGSTFSLNPSSVTMLGPDPALGGDLSGTLSAAVVGNDSHSHTGATISGLDISADTNLAVSAPITLTGDTVGIDKSSVTLLGPTIDASELPADGYADTYVNTTGDLISGQLTVTSSITVSTVAASNAITGRTLTISSNTMLSGATFYAGTVQLSSVTIVGPLSLNSTVGTSGQYLKSQGAGAPALWSTVSGVASSLAISTGGVLFSSPTPQIDLNAAQFTPSLSGTTTQIRLDASSVTLRGPNVINLQSTLQSGATLYTSSGTVQILNASTITAVNNVTLGGDLSVGDDASVTGGLNVAGGSGITATAMNIGGISVCQEDGINCPLAGGSVAISTSLQVGATYYVSSGTVLNLNTNTLVSRSTASLFYVTVSTIVVDSITVTYLTAKNLPEIVTFGDSDGSTLAKGWTIQPTLSDSMLALRSIGAATGSEILFGNASLGNDSSAVTGRITYSPTTGKFTVTKQSGFSYGITASSITISGSSSTFNGVVGISSSVHLSGSTGSSGQVFTSGGPGAVPSWTSAASGDALLASTQTWTGQEKWNSPQPSTFTYSVYAGSITTPILTVTSNTVLSGATFYQSGPVRLGNPNQSTFISSNTVLSGATFYAAPRIVFSTNVIFSPTTAGIFGTQAIDSACAGCVGEVISGSLLRSVGSSLTSATALNVVSISLTPGDWDVRAIVGYSPSGTTSVTITRAAISTTAGTMPAADTRGVPDAAGQIQTEISYSAQIPQDDMTQVIPPTRVQLSAITTYSLVSQATFSVSTLTTYGHIVARRTR